MNAYPAYLDLPSGSASLQERLRQAWHRMACCDLCPRRCRVNRLRGERGFCRTGCRAVVASCAPHFGEERPLVGRGGSGTIFFTHCNLACVFCQNRDISQFGEGREVSAGGLAALMLALQRAGCHNINLVSPSHVVAPILAALRLAIRGGLRLPLVYNTGSYDDPGTLALLDGMVDIYLPDMKFADSKVAAALVGVSDYAEVNQAAVLEMYRQVGHLQTEKGVAWRGLLVRHLVLPENLAGTDRILEFLADHMDRDLCLNLMGQYLPCHRAHRHPPLDRRPTAAELHQARSWAQALGFRRLDGE